MQSIGRALASIDAEAGAIGLQAAGREFQSLTHGTRSGANILSGDNYTTESGFIGFKAGPGGIHPGVSMSNPIRLIIYTPHFGIHTFGFEMPLPPILNL